MTKNTRFALLILAITQVGTVQSYAAPPSLSNLDFSQADSVFKTFAADTAFRPLEGASVFGNYFGVSIGVIAGATSTSLIRDVIPSTSTKYLPTANTFVAVQLPRGFALEAGVLPNITAGGLKYKSYGGDLKWNPVETFGKRLPLDIALRGMYTSTNLSYTQTVSGVNDTVTLKSNTIGANLSVSKTLLVFEPYVGVGYIKNTATLTNSGSITMFNRTLSVTNSVGSNNSSAWYYGGLQVRLLFLTLTAQYDNIFGVSSALAKIALKI